MYLWKVFYKGCSFHPYLLTNMATIGNYCFSGCLISKNLLLWNCLAKSTETCWEASMEGSVLSFLKAEWKVSDTGSVHWASSFHSHLKNNTDLSSSIPIWSVLSIDKTFFLQFYIYFPIFNLNFYVFSDLWRNCSNSTSYNIQRTFDQSSAGLNLK